MSGDTATTSLVLSQGAPIASMSASLPGDFARAPNVPNALAWQLDQVPTHRAVVHQATGMVSVQRGVVVDDALALLRAYAFAEDRPVGDVAADVVGGVLRFD